MVKENTRTLKNASYKKPSKKKSRKNSLTSNNQQIKIGINFFFLYNILSHCFQYVILNYLIISASKNKDEYSSLVKINSNQMDQT
jgi:hypothetical protein